MVRGSCRPAVQRRPDPDGGGVAPGESAIHRPLHVGSIPRPRPDLQRRLDTVSTAAWALGLGVATVVAYYRGVHPGRSQATSGPGGSSNFCRSSSPTTQRCGSTSGPSTRPPERPRRNRPGGTPGRTGDLGSPFGAVRLAAGNGARLDVGDVRRGQGGPFLLAWAMIRRRRTVVHRPFVRWDDDGDPEGSSALTPTAGTVTRRAAQRHRVRTRRSGSSSCPSVARTRPDAA